MNTRSGIVFPDSLRRRIERGRPLAPMTTFRIGGAAEFFLSCRSVMDVREAARWCAAEGLPLRVIGGGSNLLIDDEGAHGLIIDLSELRAVRQFGTTLAVEAGAKLSGVIAAATRRGLAGLEGLAGIPGAVGGAIAMNAGGRYGEIRDIVQSASLVSRKGELLTLANADLGFDYRTSRLRGGVVVSALLHFKRGDVPSLMARAAEISRQKLASQPYQAKSAGCTFRNPSPDQPAGRLIELAGLKGERRGDAEISERHGNFILNRGHARASEVLDLIETARKRVFEHFGVELRLEVKRWVA